MGKNHVGAEMKIHLREGIENLRDDKQRKIVLIILEAVLIAVFVTMLVERSMATSALEVFSWNVNIQGYWVIIIAINIFYIWLMGDGLKAIKIEDRLKRAGLKDHAGRAPIYIRYHHYKGQDFGRYDFLSTGIPLDVWIDHTPDIESALNVVVDGIREGTDREHICMYAFKGDAKIPETIVWQNSYLTDDDCTLIAGRGIAKKTIVDLRIYPHILIGGSTGSGKTILLKSLLYQSLLKGFKVVIADFKGGVDYAPFWEKTCRLITEKDDLNQQLERVLTVMKERKTLLRSANARNIDDYNQMAAKKMTRIVFACDEVAEILDKSGLSKKEKELTTLIEGKIATIARLGRAFGIHLILATQRPDANVLSGQIKNNMDYRVCGRADDVLSQIILDSTDAATKIPKHERGLFLNQSGELFRGYWLTEDNLSI